MGMPRPDPDGPGDAAADHALVPDRRTLEAVRATFGGINNRSCVRVPAYDRG